MYKRHIFPCKRVLSDYIPLKHSLEEVKEKTGKRVLSDYIPLKRLIRNVKKKLCKRVLSDYIPLKQALNQNLF